MSILSDVQSKLKAPKGQMNKFGGYKYRSCEDIVEAVKPLLAEHHAAMAITDEIQVLGDRFYVKATAMLLAEDGTVLATTSAFAREPAERKGMDDAQVTGSSSSYARKYALNGLFAIDDTKDPDSEEAPAGNAQEKKPGAIRRPLAQKYIKDIELALEEEDGLAIKELNDELKPNEAMLKFVWDYFSTEQKTKAKSLLHALHKETTAA